MEKPTPKAIALFDSAFPADERAERKQMFGMPAAFVNGNMFYGVFTNGVVLRVGEARRDELSAHDGIAPFEPMPGRPWKEYVLVDADHWTAGEDLGAWVTEALELTAAMPPKEKKPPKAKKPKAKK